MLTWQHIIYLYIYIIHILHIYNIYVLNQLLLCYCSSQAARQGLAVLMASAVAVQKHETSTFAKVTILYQLISYLAWVIKLGRSPALPNLVRIWWAVETPRGGNIYRSCDIYRSVNKTCVRRRLAENSRWRHIRLAIKPRYLGNHASQLKSYRWYHQEVVAVSESWKSARSAPWRRTDNDVMSGWQ